MAKKNYLQIVRKSGLKLTRIADKMGMSESHLRYYLGQDKPDPKVVKKFLGATKKTLKDIETELSKKDGDNDPPLAA